MLLLLLKIYNRQLSVFVKINLKLLFCIARMQNLLIIIILSLAAKFDYVVWGIGIILSMHVDDEG